jgi:site-specific recombinase XerD
MTMRENEPTGKRTNDHPWVVSFLEPWQPSTAVSYRNELRSFLRWDAVPKIEELAEIDISNYVHHEEEAGLERTTINHKIAVLRRFCRWAYREGKLQTDPAANIKLMPLLRVPAPLDLQSKALSNPEVKALLRAAGESGRGLSKRNYALLQVLLQGVRVSEVAKLRVADVVLGERAGSITVRGRSKPRKISLLAELCTAIRAYLETRHALQPVDALFTSETGGPLSVRSIQWTVSELGRRAKITRIPVVPQSLRRTFNARQHS